jgi:hypothetical protein
MMIYRHLLFILLILLSLFIWWLSGYNFDHRSESVAVGFFINLFVVIWFTLAPFKELDKKIWRKDE